MKKIICAILATALMVTSLAGCGEKVDSDTLLIGGTGPLTGDYATYGISVQKGAQIAVDEINEAGGVNGMKIALKMEDDQGDPEMAKNGYGTLFDDGMKLSIGSVTSGACIAFVEEAKKDGMLSLTPSGSQLEIVEPDNSFRICFADPGQGQFSAQFIKEQGIAEKVAIIYEKSNDYSAGITDAFVAEAKEVGLDIVTKEAFTNQSNTDFSVQLQAVKSSGADLLFLPVYAQEAAYILTQADKIGLDVQFFGCDGIDGIFQKIGEENLDLCEGFMFLTPFSADSTDEIVSNFVTAYKKANKDEVPDQFAADAYDAIYAIKAALEEAGIDDATMDMAELNEKVIAAMTEIEVTGTTGTMSWDKGGEPIKDAIVVTITDGVYEVYSK